MYNQGDAFAVIILVTNKTICTCSIHRKPIIQSNGI